MNIKKMFFMLVIIGLITSLSACNDDDPKPTEAIKVGVVLPLSGSLATLGTGLQNIANLALDEANATRSSKIEFIIEDSKSTATGATEAFSKLIEQDGVSSIIGPVTSSAAQASFPIAQQNKVVAFSPLAAAGGLSDIGDYVFQGNLSTDVVIPGGIDLTAAKFGYQNVAILVDNIDLFSQSTAQALEDSFNDKGITILTTETLETNDTDFTAQLTRIKALNPDAIFIATLPIEATNILIQADTIGFPDDVTFIIPFAFSTDEVATAGAAAEDVVTFSTWVSSANTPGNQTFVDDYKAIYSSEPSRFLAQEYATVQVFAEALKNAPSNSASDIRNALANISNLDTILGKFSFKANGQAVYDPIMLIVKNGTLVVLE